MQTQEHPTRRRPLRLIAAGLGCLVSAVFVATLIPAAREAVAIFETIYVFLNSTVPSLGVAAIWLGFALLVVGALAAWWFRRSIKEETTRMLAVGSAVLMVAFGGLVAVISSLNQPGSSLPEPPNVVASTGQTASVGQSARSSRRRRHHRRHSAFRRASSGGGAAPTRSAAPSSPSVSGRSSSSSSSGSGGNGNTVTVNKNNTQAATSGNAEGAGATSGPATNDNNEGPVSISIG